jgi:hypothetical protein
MNAPILITVYDREIHFKKTIESLLLCNGVDLTDLYIAIDGPLSKDVSLKQDKIKSYISKIKGFKSVNVIQRENNLGALKNGKYARDEVFNHHDRLIRTEDDNEFSSHFISFMNEGLETYEKNENIFSICGYLEPIGIFGEGKTFYRRGFTSNGFAIWKDKFKKMEESHFKIKDEGCSFFNFRRLILNMGYHVVSGLIFAEKMDYKLMDYYICYYLYKKSMFCIFPNNSIVRNIGQDGSGLHSGINEVLQNQEIYTDPIGYNFSYVNDKIYNEGVYRYHKRSFFHTIYQYFKFLRLFK